MPADDDHSTDELSRHFVRIVIVAACLLVATLLAVGFLFLSPPDSRDDGLRNSIGSFGFIWSLFMLVPVAYLDRFGVGELWLPFIGAFPWAVLIDVLLTLIGRPPKHRFSYRMADDDLS